MLSQFNALNISMILPECSILLGLLVTLLADVFFNNRFKNIAFIISQFFLILTIAILTLQINSSDQHGFYDMLVFDKVSLLLKLVIVIMTLFTFTYARTYLNKFHLPQGEFYTLCLSALLGMMLLVSANNLLILFLALELSSLPLYTLVALNRSCGIGSESAMKYYATGAVASGILLYGLSFLYGLAKSFNIQTIIHLLQNTSENHLLIVLIVTFVVLGIAFKLGMAPFHMWVPDVYQGAPTPVALFVGSAPKLAAVGMLFRLLIETLIVTKSNWQQLFIIIAILSIGLGNLAAIAQTNFKRMLAYSSIAQMGYMCLGFIAGTSSGYAASFFYIITYAFMAMGAFAIVTLTASTTANNGDIEELKGLNTKNPWLAFILMLIMFSMAGIPPLVGFFC